MTAQARQRPATLWRILTTPVGPRILPQIDFGPAPRTVIASAGLPVPVAAVIATVVRRTRLWRSERADVARELCSHFTEGLAAGPSPQELIDAFGDPRAAAAMIRRAKLRSRHLAWRAMRRLRQVLITATFLLLVLYAWLSLRFYTARPAITRNYAAELNAAVLAVPESDRAWPLYRQAALVRSRAPVSLQGVWGPMTPDDPRWPDLVQSVRDNQARIGLIHQAAQRPRLGYIQTDSPDAELWASRGFPRLRPQPPSPNPELLSLDTMYVSELKSAANLLVRDASVATAAGDPSTVTRDLADLIGIAEHLRELQTLPEQLASLGVFSQALDSAAFVLRDHPNLFSNADLARLAHRLASYGGGGAIRVRFDGERVFFNDLAQRLYSPDGRITPAGVEFLRQRLPGFKTLVGAGGRLSLVVGAAFVLPSRSEFVDAYERALERAREESDRPLYQRPGRGLRDPIFQRPDPGAFFASPSHLPAGLFFPALAHANLAAEQATQRRDAILTVLALELFKRRHAAYPETLASLVPQLLPAVPLDRYDGGALKYLLRGGRPLLYTCGADRDDDGGRPPHAIDKRNASDWLSTDALKQFLASRGLGPAYDGDWILWPAPELSNPAELR